MFIWRQEMFSYLVKTIERMAKQNIRKNAKYNFRKSYKDGISRSLYCRILTLGKSCSWANQREDQISAITEYVHKNKNLDFIDKKYKETKLNNTAYHRGFIDANKISLNRQATGGGGLYISQIQ